MPQVDSGKALATNFCRNENIRAKEGGGKRKKARLVTLGGEAALGVKPPSRTKTPRVPCQPVGDHAHLIGFALSTPLPLMEGGERPPGSLTKNPCRPTVPTLLYRFAPITQRNHKPRGEDALPASRGEAQNVMHRYRSPS